MSEQEKVRGGISVETEHIFPIIKKWMYSEREIFLRELVSNAADAVTKLRRLSSLGETELELPAFRIDVAYSAAEKTLTVSDNGIGMTAEEVEKYICKMALSGALDFIEKYEGKEEGDASGIIGHFGLGFYSAFMVADRVELLTKSYTGAPTVRWSGTEDGAYEWETAEDRTSFGTDVILHINEDAAEYLTEGKLRAILDRYCAFMPVDIYLTNADADEEPDTKAAPAPVNDKEPLWLKDPSECEKDDYVAFYRKVFGDYKEPLFYLHIRADYPLNFKGVLFFPKLEENLENPEGRIKLYYNQVFVADNIKEVIPEYLLMLRGVIDCPELPLNVSRSYLQNSTYVSKVSAYITKKVADKLNSMQKADAEAYAALWSDLRTFVEYGCIGDRKFYDRVAPSVLLPTADGKSPTLEAALEQAKAEGHENLLYYATDEGRQGRYIELCQSRGNTVHLAPSFLDGRFLQTLESYREGVKFSRVDTDPSALGGEEATLSDDGKALFERALPEGIKAEIQCVRLDPATPLLLTVSEEGERMREMMRLYAPDAPAMPEEFTLSVNESSPVIARLLSGGYGDSTDAVARHLFYLALLSSRPLSGDEMKALLSGGYGLLESLA